MRRDAEIDAGRGPMVTDAASATAQPAPDATTATTATTATADEQPPEQRRYATLLEWCTRIGLVLTVLAFAIYVSGIAPARVAPERLASLWHLPVHEFLRATGGERGLGWLTQLAHGDMAALAGIAFLAGCSLVPLIDLVRVSLARGERAFAALGAAEIAVIVLAASGWIGGGH